MTRPIGLVIVLACLNVAIAAAIWHSITGAVAALLVICGALSIATARHLYDFPKEIQR